MTSSLLLALACLDSASVLRMRASSVETVIAAFWVMPLRTRSESPSRV
ncbi:MAG: hypothetical protein ABI383_08560 [Acidobacteriaceae bacterium]